MHPEFFWLYQIGLGAFFLLVLLPCLRKIVAMMREGKFLSKRTVLPLQMMCVVMGVYLLGEGIEERFFPKEGALDLSIYRNALLVVLFAWFLIRFKADVYHRAHLENLRSINTEGVRLLNKIITVVIVIVAGMIGLQTLGMDITPLVAFGGVGAATLGFAAKDVFANFFGGVMLALCRPLSLGDFVNLPEKNIEGHVEEIGWYLTRIRDREKRAIYLPNSAFATMQVINSTRRSHRRVLETLHLDQRELARLQDIVALVKEVIKKHPKVDHRELLLVHFKEFETYSLGLHVEFYVTTLSLSEYFATKEQILAAIGLTLREHEVRMALPTAINISKI